MYSKSERLLITRFLFSKKTDGYISIFSWFSIIGISLGVAAIIIVMSVMNGFRIDLTKRLLGINSHITIFSNNQFINYEESQIIKKNLKDFNHINILESIETNGLIIKNNVSKGVLIRGYKYTNKEHYLLNSLIEGSVISNKNSEVIIGDSLALSLNVKIGDKIKIAIPKSDNTILGNIPRFKTLSIVGVFDFGLYEYDNNMIFIHSTLARKLTLINNNDYNKIEIFSSETGNINKIKNQIINIINNNNLNLTPITWKERNLSLINALKVEKNVMFLILTLIIIVAAFNIISGLTILIKNKTKEIAILKALGLSKKSIIKSFFLTGFIIGLTATIAGVILGVTFSIYIEEIRQFLSSVFNLQIFPADVYFLEEMPSEINARSILSISIFSIIITSLASILSKGQDLPPSLGLGINLIFR